MHSSISVGLLWYLQISHLCWMWATSHRRSVLSHMGQYANCCMIRSVRPTSTHSLLVTSSNLLWLRPCMIKRFVTDTYYVCASRLCDIKVLGLQVIDMQQKWHRVKKCTLWYSSLKMTQFWCCRPNFCPLSTITKEVCDLTDTKVRHTCIGYYVFVPQWIQPGVWWKNVLKYKTDPKASAMHCMHTSPDQLIF